MSKFQYDPFQQESIDHINNGFSTIVSAPTGAGKTAIAEYVIEDCLKNNRKVIYTAPIKALSNQKYRDFQIETDGQVGILTGDVTINSQAPLTIMTTEIFRNKLLENRNSVDHYSWVIFDEIHYLDDYERGTVWEEALIFMPDHMRFLGLSATVPNIHQLQDWLKKIHGQDIKVVKEANRPVPLHFHYQAQGQMYADMRKMEKKAYCSIDGYEARKQRLPRHCKVRHNNIHDLVRNLEKKDLLPCIYFVFSRKKTELLAGQMSEFSFLSTTERKEITKQYDELCVRFELHKDERASELRPLIEKGIAYHHAGMLPTLKEVVERLFATRLLKLIFTTETFALGINMPARSVIFDEMRKYHGRGFAPLRTRDFYQMAGRAGRRGIDDEGHVFCRIDPREVSVPELYKMINGEPEKVRSQFNASYATLLNLYQHYGENLYDVYPRSLHFFQTRLFLQKRAVESLKAKIDILKELRHIDNEKLTTKGSFASKVYGYEVILSELFEEEMLDKLSASELAILTVAIIYEPRKGIFKPKLSKSAECLESMMRKILGHVHRVEKKVGLRDLTKDCYFHLSPAVEAWMQNKPFDEIVPLVGADEGEIVRYFRMTIQLLREMTDGPVSKEFKEKVYSILTIMRRDVVDSEQQLQQ